MNEYNAKNSYPAVACRDCERRDSDSILYGASSVPGSREMLYIPLEPQLHNYGINPECVVMFRTPLTWKGEPHVTDAFRTLSQKLRSLPIVEGSFVTYMRDSGGFFFNLILKGGVRMTVSQYEDELEHGAYVNVMLGTEVVIQNYMPVDDIVSSMKIYYETE